MKTGTIVLIPFPLAELAGAKVRPAVVVCLTDDKYRDLILCAISSLVPLDMSGFEIVLTPDSANKLRVQSIIKVDRIATLKQADIIAVLGTISEPETADLKTKFKLLAD